MKKPTEQGAALIERFGLKGWQLKRYITDARGYDDPQGRQLPTLCDYCKTHLKHVFLLAPPGAEWELWDSDTFFVGSECLTVFVDQNHAADAERFYTKGWRERAGDHDGFYFQSRKLGKTILTHAYPTKRGDVAWWIAMPPSLAVWDATPYGERGQYFLEPWKVIGGRRLRMHLTNIASVTEFVTKNLLEIG